VRPRTHRIQARRVGVLVSVTLMALAGASIGVLSASAQGNEDKVTICHRTNSATNPYVSITVDQSAVDGVSGNSGNEADHFGEHKGPLASSEAVAQNLKDNGIEWGDIIPPVPPFHNGLNWPAGQAILENDCNFVTPPTTAPPTTAPPTTAPPTTAPPTTAAPTTAPPTTAAGQAQAGAAAAQQAAAQAAAQQAAAQQAAAAAAVQGQARVTG